MEDNLSLLVPPPALGAPVAPQERLDDLVVDDEEDDAGDVEGRERRQQDEVGVVELALGHLGKESRCNMLYHSACRLHFAHLFGSFHCYANSA